MPHGGDLRVIILVHTYGVQVRVMMIPEAIPIFILVVKVISGSNEQRPGAVLIVLAPVLWIALLVNGRKNTTQSQPD